jgi:hypothetical protein
MGLRAPSANRNKGTRNRHKGAHSWNKSILCRGRYGEECKFGGGKVIREVPSAEYPRVLQSKEYRRAPQSKEYRRAPQSSVEA